MDRVRRELDRLGREELQQIEAALTEARKQAEGNESRGDPARKALEESAEKSERQARELEQLAGARGREQPDREPLAEEARKLKEQAKRLRASARADANVAPQP